MYISIYLWLCMHYPSNSCVIITNYHACIVNAHMIYMYRYTYFVLTSINLICSCFVHVQQHAPPWIAGAGHPCYDRSLFCIYFSWVMIISKYWLSITNSWFTCSFVLQFALAISGVIYMITVGSLEFSLDLIRGIHVTQLGHLAIIMMMIKYSYYFCYTHYS